MLVSGLGEGGSNESGLKEGACMCVRVWVCVFSSSGWEATGYGEATVEVHSSSGSVEEHRGVEGKQRADRHEHKANHLALPTPTNLFSCHFFDSCQNGSAPSEDAAAPKTSSLTSCMCPCDTKKESDALTPGESNCDIPGRFQGRQA